MHAGTRIQAERFDLIVLMEVGDDFLRINGSLHDHSFYQ